MLNKAMNSKWGFADAGRNCRTEVHVRALVVEGVHVRHVAGLGGRGDAVGGQQDVRALQLERAVRAHKRVHADGGRRRLRSRQACMRSLMASHSTSPCDAATEPRLRHILKYFLHWITCACKGAMRRL